MNTIQISSNTLVVLFEQTINLDVFQQVSTATCSLEESLSDYIVDIVPSYASIYLLFDLRKITASRMLKKVESTIHNISTESGERLIKKTIDIPVYYGLEVGLDLNFISLSSGLSVDEIARLHSNSIYDVYAMGFAPGFAYLGSVDERIAIPRKKTPRKHIPAGSLGIADQQTAVYPSDSPGGWQIIGRTPEIIIDYQKDQPAKMQVGDRVRFVQINKKEYLAQGGIL